MADPERIVALSHEEGDNEGREYLVSNGLGGFASGTISGSPTRRQHGLLIAALPAPFGRMVMLNQVDEALALPGGDMIPLTGDGSAMTLAEFRLDLGLPVWTYRIGDVVIEKRVMMRHLHNTTDIIFTSLGEGAAKLRLKPWISFRNLESNVDAGIGEGLIVTSRQEHFEISASDNRPPLHLRLSGSESSFELRGGGRSEVRYGIEEQRGYVSRGALWSPGEFHVTINPSGHAHLCASTEPWHEVLPLSAREALAYEQQRRRRLIGIAHPSLHDGPPAELVLAADSFVIMPEGRVADAARAQAAGDEARTVIAGYHWFTDWGRDTMISLEGLTLTTGRVTEAGWILRTFAHYVRDGLIPNMFPDGSNQGLYHTADATLWFFHALHRYLLASGDRQTLRVVLPKLRNIVDHHISGTRFGIRVDPQDGLLRQGEEGYQLTWMDAKVDDWVVTPRRGKAVEINALWYNALCLLEGWLTEEGETDEAARIGAAASRVRESFNQRFWSDSLGHLFDVLDGEQGNDPACRPNQIFAISLDHPVLDESRWQAVVEIVRDRLLTPVGLRSLDPRSPDYKPKYFGNLRTRDAAYHQGTVWGWLIGPFIDAHLKLHPEDTAGARALLQGFIPHLSEHGIGSISEVFDAEAPYTPRGCISQAWSVAEVLRSWANTAEPGEV